MGLSDTLDGNSCLDLAHNTMQTLLWIPDCVTGGHDLVYAFFLTVYAISSALLYRPLPGSKSK